MSIISNRCLQIGLTSDQRLITFDIYYTLHVSASVYAKFILITIFNNYHILYKYNIKWGGRFFEQICLIEKFKIVFKIFYFDQTITKSLGPYDDA